MMYQWGSLRRRDSIKSFTSQHTSLPHCLTTCYNNLISARSALLSSSIPGSALQHRLPGRARVGEDGAHLLQDLPLPRASQAAPGEVQVVAGSPRDPTLDLSQLLSADHDDLSEVGEAGGRLCNKTDLFCWDLQTSFHTGVSSGQLTSVLEIKTSGLHQSINIRAETTGLVRAVHYFLFYNQNFSFLS